MQFSEIIEQLDLTTEHHSLSISSHLNPQLSGITSIDRATSDTISYIEGDKFAAMLSTTQAGALILPKSEFLQQQATSRNIAWIATPEPRLLFAKAIALFYQPYKPKTGIHPSAVIDSNTTIGKDVYIGSNVVIEQGVKIGDRTTVYPNTVIYPGVTIGNDTIIHANCSIHERSRIGDRCVIHSGAVIGAEGFGFVPTKEGWYKMEQSGCTVLEDEVEIGCNSTVDRPSVGETRIGRNTKLDNLVQIGHGCQIGNNCVMASQVGLAGGVKVGNWVMLGGQVGVANQVEIGDRAIATGQTGITSNVKAGEMVSGMPHMPSQLYRKLAAIHKRLPEMYQVYKNIRSKKE
jgi:UDP-3-O-[3-hydroxymyristoyl] glucosamine N-acyltransferase